MLQKNKTTDIYTRIPEQLNSSNDFPNGNDLVNISQLLFFN